MPSYTGGIRGALVRGRGYGARGRAGGGTGGGGYGGGPEKGLGLGWGRGGGFGGSVIPMSTQNSHHSSFLKARHRPFPPILPSLRFMFSPFPPHRTAFAPAEKLRAAVQSARLPTTPPPPTHTTPPPHMRRACDNTLMRGARRFRVLLLGVLYSCSAASALTSAGAPIALPALTSAAAAAVASVCTERRRVAAGELGGQIEGGSNTPLDVHNTRVGQVWQVWWQVWRGRSSTRLHHTRRKAELCESQRWEPVGRAQVLARRMGGGEDGGEGGWRGTWRWL